MNLSENFVQYKNLNRNTLNIKNGASLKDSSAAGDLKAYVQPKLTIKVDSSYQIIQKKWEVKAHDKAFTSIFEEDLSKTRKDIWQSKQKEESQLLAQKSQF